MKAKESIFDAKAILAVMESMRHQNGAFIASPASDYQAMWIRDHLYCTLTYYYLGEYEKLKQGVWLIFDLFRKYEKKIKTRIALPNTNRIAFPKAIIHAKYHPDTLDEITTDTSWGHDQLDVIGLFFHIVADMLFPHRLFPLQIQCFF